MQQRECSPKILNDCIAEENPVRVVDVCIDELNLLDLRFEVREAEVRDKPVRQARSLQLQR
jgi:hypothetical protein